MGTAPERNNSMPVRELPMAPMCAIVVLPVSTKMPTNAETEPARASAAAGGPCAGLLAWATDTGGRYLGGRP